jgi:hypothetical protein
MREASTLRKTRNQFNTFQWLIRQFEERMIVLMRHDSACCIATQVDGKSEDLPEVSRLT